MDGWDAEQQLDLHPVDADLAELARRATTRPAPQLHDAHVRLTTDADVAFPVHVDPGRITHVLTNLLDNTLIATAAGGSVTLTARSGPGRGEVVVTDTGVGLDQDDLQRVFERFYRVPSHRGVPPDQESASPSPEESPAVTEATSRHLARSRARGQLQRQLATAVGRAVTSLTFGLRPRGDPLHPGRPDERPIRSRPVLGRGAER